MRRSDAPLESAADYFEAAAFVLFLGILVWAPLPFASNRIWAIGLLGALLALVAALWLVALSREAGVLSVRHWRSLRMPLLLLVVVQVWVALQLLPLPREWVEVVSPQSALWQPGLKRIPLSLDPAHTFLYLLRGCTLTLGFAMAVLLLRSASRLRYLLWVLVLSGTLQAVYGSLMVLSGAEYGFLVEKYVNRGVATGTFVNRNHLAGYLVLSVAACLGLLLADSTTRLRDSWRERSRRYLRQLLSPRFQARIYLALMVVALVLTRSRMGNLAFISALGIAAGLYLLALRRLSWQPILLLGSIVVVDVLVVGRWFGLDQVVSRLAASRPAQEPRFWSNQYSVDYLHDFLLTGSGGGSFYGVFPNYQGAALEGFHIHAHNDYLQFAIELGLPVALLLLLFCLWAGGVAVQQIGTRQRPLLRGAGFACLMALAWAAVHSAADFNLQLPATALTLMVLLALPFASRALSGGDRAR